MAKLKNMVIEQKIEKISRRIVVGRVVSAKLPQTVTVLVERQRMHPLYRKSVKRSQKYLVHDLLKAKLGDIVEITKIKPMSKHKHFQTFKIVGQNIGAVVSKQLKEATERVIAEIMPEKTKEDNVPEDVQPDKVDRDKEAKNDKKMEKPARRKGKA